MSVVPFLVAQPSGAELRSAARSTLRLFALISFDRETQERVVVRDLSANGFRFETRAVLPLGQAVCLTIGARPSLRAEVVHSEAGSHGCRFFDRLDPAVLAGIAKAGPFAVELPIVAPPPAVWRWPGCIRMAIILGGSTAGWLTVKDGINLLLG